MIHAQTAFDGHCELPRMASTNDTAPVLPTYHVCVCVCMCVFVKGDVERERERERKRERERDYTMKVRRVTMHVDL